MTDPKVTVADLLRKRAHEGIRIAHPPRIAEDTGLSEADVAAALAALAADGMVRVETYVRCPEGHVVWGGIAAEMPSGLLDGECPECCTPLVLEGDEPNLSETVRILVQVPRSRLLCAIDAARMLATVDPDALDCVVESTRIHARACELADNQEGAASIRAIADALETAKGAHGYEPKQVGIPEPVVVLGIGDRVQGIIAPPARPMVLRDATPKRRLQLAAFDAKNPDLAGEHCHAHKDGECFWKRCPQTRNGGADWMSHCPLDRYEDEEW
jgi:hypothetical protein